MRAIEAARLGCYTKESRENWLKKHGSEKQSIFWHGSPSGDLRGGKTGLHLGTFEAATQALEARIGIPAEGSWDGSREYGKTLLAGKKRIKELGEYEAGFNVGAPEEDYFPKDLPGYSDGSKMSLRDKPSVAPYKLVGKTSNSPERPYDDFKANGYMSAQLKRGRAKSGFYYVNVGEDEGSISLVVPNGSFVEQIRAAAKLPSAGPAQEQVLRSSEEHDFQEPQKLLAWQGRGF